jgi:hypothetical protein
LIPLKLFEDAITAIRGENRDVLKTLMGGMTSGGDRNIKYVNIKQICCLSRTEYCAHTML